MIAALLFFIGVLVALAVVLAGGLAIYQAVQNRFKNSLQLQQFWNYRSPPLDITVAFDLSPVADLSNELVFRAPTAEDDTVLRQLFNDPVIAEAHHGSSAVQTAAWNRMFDDAEVMAWRRSEWLVAEERSTGEIAGLATIGPTPDGYSGVSVGLMMRDGFRRCGYGTQLVAAMLLVLQHTLMHELWAFTTPDNAAVQRILARLGYRPESGLHQFVEADGRAKEWLRFRCGREHGPPDPSIWS